MSGVYRRITGMDEFWSWTIWVLVFGALGIGVIFGLHFLGVLAVIGPNFSGLLGIVLGCAALVLAFAVTA